jgi:hypothetical protein
MSARQHHIRPKPRRDNADAQATPFEIALARASALIPEERAALQDDATRAFAAFKAGQGNLEQWRHLVDALNTSEALAQRHNIADNHVALILAGQDALAAVYARQLKSWTLRGTEIAALADALFIWRVQLDFCSRGEVAQARAFVARRSQQIQRSPVTPGMRIIGVADRVEQEAS